MAKTPKTNSSVAPLGYTGRQVEDAFNFGRTKRFELQKQGYLKTIRLGARMTRYTPESVAKLAADGVPITASRSPVPTRRGK